MLIIDSYRDLLSEIAISADLCLKPWKHSVLLDGEILTDQISNNDFSELIVRVECRDLNGERYSDNDLEK